MGGFFHRHRRKFRNLLLSIVTMFVAFSLLVIYAFWWSAVNYPYGRSHCCIKALISALEQYADVQDGHYPSGMDSPEASLSLLHYQLGYVDANLLRGKTVTEDVVQAILDQKGYLGPDTCGWHYVEGLTQRDDHNLALLWDKAGLGHNGERNPDGGQEVLFVGGSLRRIPKSEWPQFLKEQEVLLAKRHQAITE